jgi:hypothetical protein
VADHPLRPATDRRLGRPLPHQLPNRTQAAPKAHYCFVPQDICGISPSFPGLSPTSGHIPTRYSPVRRCHCWPRDLHVLSMPPAFTLSQDQTLRFIHHHQAQNPAAAPNHPALTLSPTNFPTTPRTPDTKPSPPKAPPPLRDNTRAPTAHPTPQHQAHHRTQHPKAQSTAIPQPSTQPSIRTAKNQTLPKPIQLSMNNPQDSQPSPLSRQQPQP